MKLQDEIDALFALAQVQNRLASRRVFIGPGRFGAFSREMRSRGAQYRVNTNPSSREAKRRRVQSSARTLAMAAE